MTNSQCSAVNNRRYIGHSISIDPILFMERCWMRQMHRLGVYSVERTAIQKKNSQKCIWNFPFFWPISEHIRPALSRGFEFLKEKLWHIKWCKKKKILKIWIFIRYRTLLPSHCNSFPAHRLAIGSSSLCAIPQTYTKLNVLDMEWTIYRSSISTLHTMNLKIIRTNKQEDDKMNETKKNSKENEWEKMVRGGKKSRIVQRKSGSYEYFKIEHKYTRTHQWPRCTSTVHICHLYQRKFTLIPSNSFVSLHIIFQCIHPREKKRFSRQLINKQLNWDKQIWKLCEIRRRRVDEHTMANCARSIFMHTRNAI